MAVSVGAVYNTLKDLVNKDQNGFVTPVTFNNFAQVAQLRIFNRLFDELKDAKRVNRAGFNPGRDKSRFKRIEEDLAYFTRVVEVDKTVNDVFEKPDDLSRIIGMTTNNPIIQNQSYRRNIELVYDEDKIERILLSDISAPSAEFPVALVSNNIEVFPSTIDSIRLRYYKIPQGVASNGSGTALLPAVVVDANDAPLGISIDFELPEHYLEDLVIEIAQLIGVSLRDQFVVTAAQGEQNERKQESTY